MSDNKYVPIDPEDHNRIIKGQTDGLSVEMAVYNAGYQKGKAEALHPSESAGVSSAVWVKEEFTEIDKARFWTKVSVTNYCWLWLAGRNPNGYGMFKHHGYDEHASRVSYKLVNGYIPNDLHVLHKCDNPQCVNPDHLFTGTHQDNMNDRMRKGRGKVLGSASRYHGVAFRKDSNNWRAQAFDGRKHLSLGSYATEEEAAKARDKAVLELGLNLPLNFPEPSSQSMPLDESPAAAQSGKEDITDHEHEKEIMMQAFDKVRQLFEMRSWIMEGRGSYPYNDDRYREEVRYLYDEFDALFKDTWKNIKSKTFEYRNKIIEQYKKESGKQEAVQSNKEDAVAFSEWCNKKCSYCFGGWKSLKNDKIFYTTSQLYDIYKQSK